MIFFFFNFVSFSQIEIWGNCTASIPSDYIHRLEPQHSTSQSCFKQALQSDLGSSSPGVKPCHLLGSYTELQIWGCVILMGNDAQKADGTWLKMSRLYWKVKSQSCCPLMGKKNTNTCLPKTPVEVTWSTQLAVKFPQTVYEHLKTLWNNCLNSKLQLFH